jgi:dihydrofolate reductase
MRKIIAALQASVDGFIEGPDGGLDWAMAEDEATWRDLFEMLAWSLTMSPLRFSR